MSFNKIYQDKKDEFEKKLATIFSGLGEIPSLLREAMAYSLLDGGKRIRPILFLEIFRMFRGIPTDEAYLFAASLECIHAYSLVHDDLPCMDDDDMRRGKPTNHIKFGQGVAVLAGDALLNLAYELIFDAIKSSDNTDLFVKAASFFAARMGARGLIAGQIADITADDHLSSEEVQFIFHHKTGAIISAACVCGAIIGGATKDEIAHMLKFADNFAFAFQVRDDILDRKEKDDAVSFVKVYGLTRATQTLGDSTQQAQAALDKLKGKNTEFLRELTMKFATRKE